MASAGDREAELFARDLYRYVWDTFAVTSGRERKEENEEESSFTPKIGLAVIYTQMFVRESLKRLFQETLTNASEKEVFEVLTKYLNTFLVIDDKFLLTVNASATIAEFMLYQYNLGKIDYLLYGETCWTTYFNIYLRRDFYANGGWKSFVAYAEGYVREAFDDEVRKKVKKYVQLHRYKYLRGTKLYLLRTKDLPLKSPKQDLGAEEAEGEGEGNAEVQGSSSGDSRPLDDNPSLHHEAIAKLHSASADTYPETSDSHNHRHRRKSRISKKLTSGKRVPSAIKSISSQEETEKYITLIDYLQALYASCLTLSSRNQQDPGKEVTVRIETSKSSQDQSKEGAQESQEKCKLPLDPKVEETSNQQASAEEIQDTEVTRTPKKGKKKRRSSKKH